VGIEIDFKDKELVNLIKAWKAVGSPVTKAPKHLYNPRDHSSFNLLISPFTHFHPCPDKKHQIVYEASAQAVRSFKSLRFGFKDITSTAFSAGSVLFSFNFW
jgi:hypothetical protein